LKGLGDTLNCFGEELIAFEWPGCLESKS